MKNRNLLQFSYFTTYSFDKLETALITLCITENSSTEGREKGEKGMAEREVRWEYWKEKGRVEGK